MTDMEGNIITKKEIIRIAQEEMRDLEIERDKIIVFGLSTISIMAGILILIAVTVRNPTPEQIGFFVFLLQVTCFVAYFVIRIIIKSYRYININQEDLDQYLAGELSEKYFVNNFLGGVIAVKAARSQPVQKIESPQPSTQTESNEVNYDLEADYYSRIDKCRTDEELLLYMNKAARVLDRTQYPVFVNASKKAFEAAADRSNNSDDIKQAIKEAFVETINTAGGMKPVSCGELRQQCPLCKTVQHTVRKVCSSCGVKFVSENNKTPMIETLPGDNIIEGEEKVPGGVHPFIMDDPKRIICPNCGTEQRRDRICCYKCGVEFSGVRNIY